jgi:hypothetical protein
MIQQTITCDRCGLLIEPLDDAFDGARIAGGGSLIALQRTNGGLYHNQVPPDGWHFHYLCFGTVVEALSKILNTSSREKTEREWVK